MFALDGRYAACIRGLLGYDFNWGEGRYEKPEKNKARQEGRKKLMTVRDTDRQGEG